MRWHRRFYLYRKTDHTGCSGTGVVAQGCQNTDGRCVLFWNGEHASTVLWLSIDDVIAIHGHGGATVVIWLDEESTR